MFFGFSKMALTDLLSVAKAARDVLGGDVFTDADCLHVATALKTAGLSTYASLRIGFPPDPDKRSAFVKGWCDEVGLIKFVDLVDAMAAGALSLSLTTCSAPMVTGSDRFTAKRLHGGAWVETDACVVKSAPVSGHQVAKTTIAFLFCVFWCFRAPLQNM